MPSMNKATTAAAARDVSLQAVPVVILEIIDHALEHRDASLQSNAEKTTGGASRAAVQIKATDSAADSRRESRRAALSAPRHADQEAEAEREADGRKRALR